MNWVAWVLAVLVIAAAVATVQTGSVWLWILTGALLVAAFLTEMRIAWIKVRAMEKGDDPL